MNLPWTTSLRIELAALKAQLAAEENRRERAEHDLERMRQDFNTVVTLLGNRAQARQTSPLERDPFAEIESNLDVFLSPAPGEFIDPEIALEALTDEAEEGQLGRPTAP